MRLSSIAARARVLLLAVLGACLVVLLAGGPAASPKEKQEDLLSILVFGDSYSAGNGAGDYYGAKKCRRSARNYAREFERIVEREFGQRGFVENRACSGAVTRDFFRRQPERDVPAQVHAVNKGYDLILFTFGGNDVNFAGIVQQCLIKATDHGKKCEDLLTAAENELRKPAAQSGTLARRLRSILTLLDEDSHPRAKIVLLGYPYLEGDSGYQIAYGPPENPTIVRVGERVRALGDAGDALQQRLINQANTRAGKSDRFIFLPTKSLFAGPPSHELFAESLNPNRWMVDPSADASLVSRDTWHHPNPTGHHMEAELLAADPRVPHDDLNDGPQRTTSSNRLCVNPSRHYLVYKAKNLSCRSARRVVKKWRRKYIRGEGQPVKRVGRYHCSALRSGMYWGLYGIRTKCRHRGKRVLIYSRGE